MKLTPANNENHGEHIYSFVLVRVLLLSVMVAMILGMKLIVGI